jgi:hypothetical protein
MRLQPGESKAAFVQRVQVRALAAGSQPTVRVSAPPPGRGVRRMVEQAGILGRDFGQHLLLACRRVEGRVPWHERCHVGARMLTERGAVP